MRTVYDAQQVSPVVITRVVPLTHETQGVVIGRIPEHTQSQQPNENHGECEGAVSQTYLGPTSALIQATPTAFSPTDAATSRKRKVTSTLLLSGCRWSCPFCKMMRVRQRSSRGAPGHGSSCSGGTGEPTCRASGESSRGDGTGGKGSSGNGSLPVA